MLLYIPVILGTAREGRRSEQAAKFVLNEMQKNQEISTELLDVRDYPAAATKRKGDGRTIGAVDEKIARADGYVIVSPEYNHGYPGELKIFLDTYSREYEKKPVGICGVSNGAYGGVRMVEQLRLVAIDFKMIPIREAVYFANVETLFNNDGSIKDAAYSARVQKLLDELIWYAEVLREGRGEYNAV